MSFRSPPLCGMRDIRKISAQNRNTGIAVIELVFVLPLLLLMTLAIFDIARGIQANIVLVSIAREGGSLASRSSSYTYQQIMDSLAATTPPLDMANRGMIYITKVMGHSEGGMVRNVVVEQYRWQQGWKQSHYIPSSNVWTCGDKGATSWASDGSCSNLPSPGSTSPAANVMTGQLTDGEIIYAVETYYRYQALFGGINVGSGLSTPLFAPNFYALTLY